MRDLTKFSMLNPLVSTAPVPSVESQYTHVHVMVQKFLQCAQW